MPGTRLLRRDWEKDHVYLVQFPRAGCMPSPSPFSLKVETWLRMADIPYTNVSNDFIKMSEKGQTPFIEVNGRHVADSNIIIDHLIEEFHKKNIDDWLTPIDKSYSRAYHALVEDSLRWVILYQRARDNKWFATDQGFLQHFNGVKKFAFKNVLCERLRKRLMNMVMAQGIAKYTPEEVVTLAKKDLDAISMFLGNKKYFFGEKPTTLDCTMFAFLSQFIYTPLVTPEIMTHMGQNNQNLVSFVSRMKEAYWPDWEEATKNLSMDSKWKK
ncbi:hypothetical protein DICVIV_02556 [Dictyocaulus viviparus]|uniref:Glutathione S-transferase protein n=1 Tax=Dictyocaulus viviparus TaxID=29172 RepID=A0A0D8Y524_DICVI|nr:hypothetical protein DICVIV_02556 [Dictyocaulus viviparus]